MDKDTLGLFSLYNSETNKKMNAIIKTLEIGQWQHEFKGFFPSIESLCNHIYIGDYFWLKRFSQFKSFNYINNDVFKKRIRLTGTVLKTVEEYLEKREILDACLHEFIGELDTEDINRDFIYKNFEGDEIKKNFGGLILHVFNHQTHHRGMISIYLEELGVPNDFSNFNQIL